MGNRAVCNLLLLVCVGRLVLVTLVTLQKSQAVSAGLGRIHHLGLASSGTQLPLPLWGLLMWISMVGWAFRMVEFLRVQNVHLLFQAQEVQIISHQLSLTWFGGRVCAAVSAWAGSPGQTHLNALGSLAVL